MRKLDEKDYEFILDDNIKFSKRVDFLKSLIRGPHKPSMVSKLPTHDTEKEALPTVVYLKAKLLYEIRVLVTIFPDLSTQLT